MQSAGRRATQPRYTGPAHRDHYADQSTKGHSPLQSGIPKKTPHPPSITPSSQGGIWRLTATLLTRLTPLWLILACDHTAARDGTRPNIILIMADDLGYGDVGCYGQRLIETPHIDRLAAEGLRFTQAYAGACVCTSSRSALMTGLHGGHTPARDNIPHYHTYIQEEDVTVAEILRGTGYECGGIGKWSLGDPGTAGRPTNQGFTSWLGYLNQDHAHFYYPTYLDDGEGRLELPANRSGRHDFSHTYLTNRALEFVSKRRDTPFFFYAAYTLPHFSSPLESPTRLPIPDTGIYREKSWPEVAKRYAAMITLLDRDVGRIVARLDELGIRDNTLVIFTADNGPWGNAPELFKSSGPFRGGKRSLYEGGIRVPFIANWPAKITPNQAIDTAVAFWDLMPTFAELAMTDPPADTDGVSICNAFRGQSLPERREPLYWDYGHARSRYLQAVREGSWKLIRSTNPPQVELYDLSSDISEKHDVSTTHQDVVARLTTAFDNAVTPSERYRIGRTYKGSAIWSASE